MTASDVVAATSESHLRPDRPDAFISYSRRDGGFVSDRLVPALVNAGQDIWLDLDDIPAGTDWEARIADGLDAAKAVICVLSPDYAASAICEYEVTRASERQKLLIPILRRDVAPTALPPPLRALNWVLLRDEDPFEPQIARLLEALADDLPWRDMHARLAVRAREWEASSDNSYLLRGKDLDAAEEWLRDQERHQAHPTGSQTSYIVASRQASTRRRSVTLGAVGVALLITAALAVVALISRGQAVHRAQIAQSRELAAAAVSELNTDPEASVLLARTAAGIEPTLQAEDALRLALGSSHGLASMPAGSRVWATDASADGRLMLTAGADLEVRIWDRRAREQLATIRAPGGQAPTPSLQELPIVASFDPSGERIAVGSTDTATVAVVEWKTKRVVFEQDGYVNVAAVAFSPDGRELAVSSVGPGGMAQIWDWQAGTMLTELGDAGDSFEVFGVSDAQFDPSGTRLVTAAGVGGVVRVWDWRSDELLRELQVSREFTERAGFSPNGRLVVVASSDGSATVWRWSAGQLVADLRGHRGAVEDAAFTADGDHVLTAGEDRVVLVWEWKDPRVISELRGHRDRVVDVTPLPRTALALSGSLDGTARIWTRLWPDAAKIPRTGGQSEENVEAFTPRGRLLLAHSGKHDARLVDARTGKTLRRFHEPRTIEFDESAGPVINATLARDGSRVVTNSEAGPRVWDADSAKSLAKLDAPSKAPGHAGISPDGRQVVVPVDDGLMLWEWQSGKTTRLSADRAGDAQFDREGRVVAASIGTEPARTQLWDIASRKALGSVPGGLATFSPDGGSVMTIADQIYLWDVTSRRQVAVLRPPSQAYDATFTADGRLVISAHGDAGIRVWNWRTGQLVETIPGMLGAFGPLALSPDDRLIAINTFSTAARYQCGTCGPLSRLGARARRYVTRALTAEERERYGIEP